MDYKYYIGLDAHSRSCTFAVMNGRGKVLDRHQVPTEERLLLDYLRSFRGNKALVFEETTVSHWLYVLLKGEVNKLVVCNPVMNKKRSKAKTDFLDAVELADLLRVDRLEPVFHIDDELMDLRTLISGHQDLVQELTRCKNRYKALFRKSALHLSGTTAYGRPEVIEQLPCEQQKFVAKRLFAQLELLQAQKKDYEKQFRDNVRKHKPIRLVQSIPGFGPVLANQVVGIVVSPHRFANKGKFFAYAMLVKHIQSSDGRVTGKKRTNGSKQLKAAFRIATLAALRSDNAYRRKYDEMRLRVSSDRVARQAVARAQAAAVLGVWKSDKKYNDRHRELMRARSCPKNMLNS